MIPFNEGVKFITAVPHKDGKIVFKEQRLSRALDWFTRWHIAWAKEEFPQNEKRALAKAEAAIKLVKERGGWPDERTLRTARDQYQKWKEQDKSHSAKCSRSKRGKRKDKDKRRGVRGLTAA